MESAEEKSETLKVKKLTGKVIGVDVKGYGPNSAQLLFSVEGKVGGTLVKESFVARGEPTHEPQVFNGITTIVTAAFVAGKTITVYCLPQHSDTHHVIEVLMEA